MKRSGIYFLYLSKIFERFEKAKIALHREAEKIGQAIFYQQRKN